MGFRFCQYVDDSTFGLILQLSYKNHCMAHKKAYNSLIAKIDEVFS